MKRATTVWVLAILAFATRASDAAEISASKNSRQSLAAIHSTYRGHPFSLFMLHQELVQKDLGLSDAQKAEVAALVKGYAREARGGPRKIKDLVLLARPAPTGPHGKALRELYAALNEISGRYETSAVRLLDARQRTRLEELKLQSQGIRLFVHSKISEKLGFTPAQKERITSIFSQCERECDKVARTVRERKIEGAQAEREIAALRRRAKQEMTVVLTATQSERLAEILGPAPPFEPSELVLRVVLDP